jgi:outer membrane lipoprotein-sorting protein
MLRKRRKFALFGGIAILAIAGVGPARADEKADALLKEIATATKATKTLTADITMTMTGQGQNMKIQGKVRLKKPNLALIDLSKPFDQVIASDGKTVWMLMKSANQYTKEDADPQGHNINSAAIPISLFFDTQHMLGQFPSAKARLLPPATVEGKSFQVIELTGDTPASYTMKLYADANMLITRIALEMTQGAQKSQLTAALNNVQVGQPLADATFAYAPPKTATLYKEPDYAAKLVAVGKDAPNFTIPSPSGGQVALGEALRGKKALIVNFWFYG